MSFDLRLGDCLDTLTGLCSLPDKSVDHVICDPPYSRDLYSRTRTNRSTGLRPDGRPVCRSEGADRTSALQLASLRIGAIDGILEAVALEVTRVARRWILVFHDVEIAGRWKEALGETYVRLGVWVKTDPMPQVTGDRPGQGFEACTIAHPRGQKRWNGGGRAAVWTHGTSKGDERPDHPSPKPVALMEALVTDFTDPGELILDPFAGSGTTGVAAIRLGRRFLGWERDPKYHAAAVRRLAGTREQLGLALGPKAPKAKQGVLLP